MAKEKPKPKRDEVPMPAAAPARPGQRSLGLYLDEPLHEALKQYINATRPKPSKTAVVEAALEEYLQRAGFWPPPEAE